MKTTQLILPLLATSLLFTEPASSQEIIFADEPGFGPIHSSFRDRGFPEVFYTNSGTAYFPNSESTFGVAESGLVEAYRDADGNVPDGIHIFYNPTTGETGILLPPSLSPTSTQNPVYVASLVSTLETSISSPDPQSDSLRTASTLRGKGQGRMSGISAGDKYVIPEASTPDGARNAVYAEYNYVDIGTDRLGVGNVGEINVYSVGYEHVLNDNLFLDISYEYSDEALRQVGGAVDIDTHTVAGAISAVLVNNIYGMLIGGGSWSDGGTTIGGVQLAGANGEILFINPGIGTNVVFGNLILDTAASYLYQDATTTTNVGAARFIGNNQLGQVVLEAGARYNITDTLYARVGLQYNNIVDEDFAAAVPLDKNWLQINSEIGVELASGIGIYVGHAFDASHRIYDTHTARAGISYSF